MNTIDTNPDIQAQEERETALLVSLDTGEYDVETSLAELAELAETAGAEVLGTLTQKMCIRDSTYSSPAPHRNER